MITLFGVGLLLPFTSSNVIGVEAQTQEDRIANGLSFSASDIYRTGTNLKSMPKTFEAVIKVPTTYSSKRAGVIVGNYVDTVNACYNFELQYDNAQGIYPKLFYEFDDASLGNFNLNFTKVDLPVDEYFHLTITHDGSFVEGNKTYSYAKCYINGELAETGTLKVDITENASKYQNFNYVPSNVCAIGGDLRTNNVQNFKGNIKGVTLYSDVRTDEEVAQDYQNAFRTVVNDDNLLASYNFTQDDSKYLLDQSANKYHLNSAEEEEETPVVVEGLKFGQGEKYIVDKKLTAAPKTIEAEIQLPKSYVERPGIIFGNYGVGKSFNIELAAGGRPRVYYHNSEGTLIDKTFSSSCDIRSNKVVHLAITNDVTTNKLSCYINGEYVESISSAGYEYIQDILSTKFLVGGDNRSGNEQYFKGTIKSVAAYQDVRTANEIKNDFKNGVSSTDADLILSYNFTNESIGKDNQDISKNNYLLVYENLANQWFTEKTEVSEYDYSFAIVGDTQILANKYPYEYVKLYDWIIDNVEDKKIGYVMGMGDITDGNSAVEWQLARQQLGRLDNVVNYSVVRGNHDSTDKMNQYIASDFYYNQFDGFYNDMYIDNAYRAFTLGQTNYLLFTLDYGANDNILSWVGSVIEQYPDHKVIITTHCYLFRDGTTLGSNDVCPPADSNDANIATGNVYNNGEQMWDKLVSKYGNIELVLSGHDPCEDVVLRQEAGVHGNIVSQLLIDPQGMDSGMGATGMVAMLYINEEKEEIEVEFYSTSREAYFKKSNQFTFDISGAGDSLHNLHTVYDEHHHWTLCNCCPSYVGQMVPHIWDEGNIIKQPSYDEGGIKEFRCRDCEATYTETIEKLIPNEEPPIKEPPLVVDDTTGLTIGLVVGSVVIIGGVVTTIVLLKKKKINKEN